MASCSGILSEAQVLCSVCLDVFTEPVSLPCGHNFCKACISTYWDCSDLCQCPLCKDTFSRRPELRVNTAFRDLVENIKRMTVRDEESSPARPGEVPCDVCTGRKLTALKSCLVCQTSYCETHLEPHLRVAALKKHKLICPVENLESRMCKKHNKLFELFCRKDQSCVCVTCMNADHKAHAAVPLEQEYRLRKAEVAKMVTDIDQMVKSRYARVQQIQASVEAAKRNAQKEISDSVAVYTALVRAIERSQADLIFAIEDKQKAGEGQCLWLIKELEREITELKRRSFDLNQLSHTEDHLHFLQSYPPLSTLPRMRDWPRIFVPSGASVGQVFRAMSRLEDTLMKHIRRVREDGMKEVQQYEVDVVLDPDTAHPQLYVSEDGKQVHRGDVRQDHLPDNPERFDVCVDVMAKQGFSKGRHYFEVQVEGKTKWDLGVAKGSIDRKGNVLVTKPANGFFTIRLKNEVNCVALEGPPRPLSLRGKVEKVGVLVDYEDHLISFYDVKAKSHIYSFIDSPYNETLYPILSPSVPDPDSGDNYAPLIITPVSTQPDEQHQENC